MVYVVVYELGLIWLFTARRFGLAPPTHSPVRNVESGVTGVRRVADGQELDRAAVST